MAIAACNRCGKYVDLDWHVEEIVYVGKNMTPTCQDCLTEAEVNKLDPGAFPDVEPCDYEVVE